MNVESQKREERTDWVCPVSEGLVNVITDYLDSSVEYHEQELPDLAAFYAHLSHQFLNTFHWLIYAWVTEQWNEVDSRVIQDGPTLRDFAESIGKDPSGVRRALIKAGVPMHKERRTDASGARQEMLVIDDIEAARKVYAVPQRNAPTLDDGFPGVCFVDEHRIAELTSISVNTLRAWRTNGDRRFPYYKLGDDSQSAVRYNVHEVMQAIEAMKQ